MQTTDQETLLRIVETGVAISDSFHTDRKAYEHFYRNYCEDLSGFPGIWKLISEVAIAFETEWLKRGCDDDWMEAVSLCAATIYIVSDEINPASPVFVSTVVQRTIERFTKH